MFKKITYSFAILALLSAQACSTVFNGGSQSIVANSDSEGDESIAVEVSTPNGSYRSKLPTTIVTSPSSFTDTQISVTDKCYEETSMSVGKSVTPSFWVNLLWGLAFPVAMGIDYLDGHMWKMDQQVIVPLNKLDKCGKK